MPRVLITSGAKQDTEIVQQLQKAGYSKETIARLFGAGADLAAEVAKRSLPEDNGYDGPRLTQKLEDMFS